MQPRHLPTPTRDRPPASVGGWRTLALLAVVAMSSGCAGLRDARPVDWWRNGLLVGPNYCRPAAPAADDWIDADSPKLIPSPTNEEDFAWWETLGDPVLNGLVQSTYEQNLTLRAAGQRVLQARTQLAITTSGLFPQHQAYEGGYTHVQRSRRGDLTGLNELNNRLPTPIQIPRTLESWRHGFTLGWEIDVWGRFRRAIEASDARLGESVQNYDAILVSLIADTATAYVQLREYQQRIALAEQSVALQQSSFGIAKARFDQGAVTELDIDQATATLANTKALLPQLSIQQRIANNQLCVLVGLPPANLASRLPPAPVPAAPAEVVVGIPAELIRRRPDVRAAERRVAAESALIGVATAELYPAFSITGSLGWHASEFSSLFTSAANNGTVGPSFHWNILNYGRIANNVRVQESKFREQVALYQQTVLRANQEAEDAIVSYLQSRELVAALQESVDALKKSSAVAVIQYRNGQVDFNRVATVQSQLVTYQDNLASAQASVALSLIQIYKALGGGWQIRCGVSSESVVAAAEPERLPPVEPDPPLQLIIE
ncbi:Outer membrane protein OprM precursor [Posidoniimonas corsicana]|uniref:Outer membrane protein OprM n=1 Tax=Posidoniimonas corsicana TaxID=1938618 RepID=A0A5C5UT14_9BACT|nr:TolC family protein [Posidoniimonas corsicana]TWT29326.1 Outer membrane protein OprM precursor [Posidoniimonas corsicana]